MDQRERMADPIMGMQALVDRHQAGVWTTLPGVIQSFDPATQTAVVQPAIQAVMIDPKSLAASNKNLPLLLDVPIVFPAGGGCTLTFPVAKGDECMLVFASRSIDAWWQSGGIQAQVEARMHDLSDAVAFVGISSKPNVIESISTAATQLRSDDGSTVVSLDPNAQTLVLAAPGGATVNADVVINGKLTVNGDFAATGAVQLGGTGGPAVARVGDPVSGGVITSGSSKVKAS